MPRMIVWKLADLPPKPAFPFGLNLDDVGRGRLAAGQFGALLRYLVTHYGIVPEGMTPEPDPSADRLQALVNGLLGKARRLEYDDPPEVIQVMGKPEVTLRFYVVPAEVDRLTSGIILALPLTSPPDANGRELHTLNAETRIWYQREGNLAQVEILHDGAWKLIDVYNPIRILDPDEDPETRHGR